MSRIVLLTHTHDNFQHGGYLLGVLARHWVGAGHHVTVVAGPGQGPRADVAVMHLDLSLIPSAYAEASRQYPVVVNGAATDIRKRRVSRHLVTPGDAWAGPVIVKTDLNYGGIPEARAINRFRQDGRPADFAPGPVTLMPGPYPIFRSARDVPEAAWNNPGLVVERFLPERDARGYWVRIWTFFGDRERCSRYCSSDPIVKRANLVAHEPAPVPDELRVERERLGFDYGKFDFVVVDGQAILLDANRTPGAPAETPEMNASNAQLASGLDAMLRRTH